MTESRNAYDEEFHQALIAVDSTGLSKALSELGVGIWLLDFATDELHVGRGLLDILGYEEPPGRSRSEVLSALYPQSQIDDIRQATDDLIKDGAPFNMSTNLRRANGNSKRLVTRGRAIFDDHGKATHLIGVVSSRDDLELAESNLDQIESLNQTGSFRYDYLTDLIELSPGACHLLGYEQINAPRRADSVFGHYHKGDRQQALAKISDAEKGDGAFGFDARIRTTTGVERHIRVVGRVEFGSDGEPVARVGVVQDQTERLRDERKLLEAKQYLDRAEAMAHLGHWRYDLINDDLFWSPGVFLIHAHNPGSFKPDRAFARSRYLPEDLPLVEGIIDSSLATRQPFEYQVRIFNREDDVRHIKVQGEVETDDNDIVVAYFGTAQDVTTEVLREQQTRQAQKMEAIGNITGGMAHDFNNVLGVILGNLEIVLDDLEDDQARSMIQSSIEATLRGGDLTKNMLSFARRASLDAKTLSLNSITKQSLKWIGRTLPANITVNTALDAEVWNVEADRGSTENAILNLIINARDAMPSGGRLTIETRNLVVQEGEEFHPPITPGRFAMLAIADTGGGISAEDLERIFEPFFTTKEPGQGTGLGLAMVHGFMLQSGGAVRVHSEIGVGTTIELLFRAVMDAQAGSDLLDEVAPNATKGVRVLLVEDEIEIANLVSRMLRKAGYSVVTANSGDDALKVFRADPDFEVLLSDIVMPGSLQGPALSKALREIKPDLPAVFMSGYANEALVHGNGLRPDDLRLMKPVRRNDLISAIEAHTRKDRKNRL